ncbi:MAG TPA: hypothetical protein PL070_07960, partial [Flavobacteriales bacterium]|nr:hypothetical protein [Flavobacteriales bacterium]
MPSWRHILLSPLLLWGLACGAQITWRTDSLMNTWAVTERMTELGPSTGRGVVRAVDTRNLYEDLKQEAPG